MEWYVGVLLFLSASTVGSLIFIVNMVFIIDSLRIENQKLKIDLRHK